jgi:hypothetical protein
MGEASCELIKVLFEVKLSGDGEGPAAIVGNETGRANNGGRRNLVFGAKREM